MIIKKKTITLLLFLMLQPVQLESMKWVRKSCPLAVGFTIGVGTTLVAVVVLGGVYITIRGMLPRRQQPQPLQIPIIPQNNAQVSALSGALCTEKKIKLRKQKDNQLIEAYYSGGSTPALFSDRCLCSLCQNYEQELMLRLMRDHRELFACQGLMDGDIREICALANIFEFPWQDEKLDASIEKKIFYEMPKYAIWKLIKKYLSNFIKIRCKQRILATEKEKIREAFMIVYNGELHESVDAPLYKIFFTNLLGKKRIQAIERLNFKEDCTSFDYRFEAYAHYFMKAGLWHFYTDDEEIIKNKFSNKEIQEYTKSVLEWCDVCCLRGSSNRNYLLECADVFDHKAVLEYLKNFRPLPFIALDMMRKTTAVDIDFRYVQQMN